MLVDNLLCPMIRCAFTVEHVFTCHIFVESKYMDIHLDATSTFHNRMVPMSKVAVASQDFKALRHGECHRYFAISSRASA